MDRRAFMAGASAVAAGAVAGAGAGATFWREQRMHATVNYAGRDQGHWLRDHRDLPQAEETLETEVLIAGSGAAGLTAAWQLRKHGVRDVMLIAGPEHHGNAAAGSDGELVFPTGAHYLPLPSLESHHIREMLSDFGIIRDDPYGERPTYDERYLVHAPAERVLYRDAWEEGYLPNESLGSTELEEHSRFFALIDSLSQARGADGRRAFAVPLVMSSNDPRFTRLDSQSFKSWLDESGFRGNTLRWYLDYCCRDDYGRHEHEVSAWAGLHYFCSRASLAANAERGAVLTWPDGLAALTTRLERAAAPADPLPGASVAQLRIVPHGVEALCVVPQGSSHRVVRVKARQAIAAMPLFVLQHVLREPLRVGFDKAADVPAYAPWLVANFILSRFPEEQAGVPLAWDNVVFREPGLGYVVATHQELRVGPPPRTAFTAYHALSNLHPDDARRWLESTSVADLTHLAAKDLRLAYGWRLPLCVERVDITVRGHGMAIPTPGFLARRALRNTDGPLYFAHADLSGMSLFEEAAWWGYQAAAKVIGAR